MELKGEEQELLTLASGTPISLENIKEFGYALYEQPLKYVAADVNGKYPENTHNGYATIPFPEVGVVETNRHAGYLPEIRVYKDGGFIGIARSNHTERSMPSAKVKTLTGLMGKRVRKAYTDSVIDRFGTWQKQAIYVGADPEFFFENAGVLVPAWEVLPEKSEDAKEFWDGFQAEIRPSPNLCYNNHADAIQLRMRTALQLARKKFPSIKISHKPVMYVPRDILGSLEFKYVNFGCEPSENAYGHEWKPVEHPEEEEMRPAGGHFHFGDTVGYTMKKIDLVKAIDAIGGVATVALFDGMDDPKRRERYGRAGEYRFPKHGLEYRVLSNVWLRHPALAHITADLLRMPIHMYAAGLTKHWIATEQEVQECINSSNVIMARTIIARNKKMFDAGMKRHWEVSAYGGGGPQATPEVMLAALYKVINGGFGEVMERPEDVGHNWRLDGTLWTSHAESDNVQWNRTAKNILSGTKI